MKNKEIFERSINILVKAYHNDTLTHGDCKMCAVGNLINSEVNPNFPEWHYHFTTMKTPKTHLDDNRYDIIQCGTDHIQIRNHFVLTCYPISTLGSQMEIESTGYTVDELSKIEWAFETAPKGDLEDEWIFNGLIAVYNTLCEIHEVDKEKVAPAELVFEKNLI